MDKKTFSHKKKLATKPTFSKTASKLNHEIKLLKAKGKKKINIEVHRAAGIYEYENTLKAVRKAIEMGMTRVETDVWLTKDQTVIILHGEKDGYITTVDKKRDLIENFEYNELKTKVQLPNGDYIPTLEEYLDLCRGKLRVNIELKGERLELLDKVLPIVQKTKMLGSICFSSFYHPFYDRFLDLKKKLNIKEEISFGFLMWLEEECKAFFSHFPKRFNENKNSVNLELTLLLKHRWIREKVKELKQKGISVAIYYPFVLKETFQNCKFLSDLGVDTAICNDPIVLKKFNSLFDQ